MDKYLTPNGSLVEESVLRSKYGGRFDELVSNGTLTLQVSEEISASQYVTPNGSVLDEGVLRSKYGERFDSLVSEGKLKKKDDSVLPSEAGLSVQPTQVDEQPKVEVIESSEAPTAIERAFGKNTVTDYMGDIYRAAVQGASQADTIDDALKIFGQSEDISDENLQAYIESVKTMDSMPQSDEMTEFNKIYEENGGGVLGVVLGLGQNPSVIPQVFTSSIFAMLNPAVAAGAGVGALTGAGTGALAGAALGPGAGVTAATGAVSGAIGGMTTALETGLSYTEFLKEEIQDKGLTFDKDGIRQTLQDPEAVKRIRNKSLARGATIGAIDALTGGLAGKLTTTVARKAASKAIGAATGGAVEMLGGSAGEAIARGVVGQEMEAADIVLEGVAGAATAPITVARGILNAPVYKIKDQVVSRRTIQDVIDTATPEQMAAIDMTITNDPDLKGFVEGKRKEAIIDYKIKEALPGLTEEDRGRVVQLETQRQNLQGNDTKIAKNKLASIEKQIDDITAKYEGVEVETTNEEARQALADDGITEPTDKQIIDKLDELNKEKLDAVQEPSTEEVPLRDQPAVSEEVVEEVPLAEEPTTEGQVQEEEVEYTLPEDPNEAKNDFEIIDNRGGKADLEIDGKQGNWYVRNKVTDKIVAATSKKEAQSLIDDPVWDYGEGDMIVQEVKRDFVTMPSIEKPFIVPSPNTGRPTSTQINFTEDGKIESIVNKNTGKEVSEPTKRKAEEVYLKGVIDVNAGKKADIEEGITEQEYTRYILDNSENIREIAEAIDIETKRIKEGKVNTEELFESSGLADLAGLKFTSDSWKIVTGKTPKQSKIDKYWIDDTVDERTGEPNGISVEDGWTNSLAREGELPVDVTDRIELSEVIDFITTNNTEAKVKKLKADSAIVKTPTLVDLEAKFSDLTSTKATPSNIETVLSIESDARAIADVQAEAEQRAQMEAEDPGVFGKKRGPSPKKITGEKPTMVTVDEAKALTDQIRLEARAAREARLDQNKRRQDIITSIRQMSSTGKISSPQAKAVINRISKVNLNNETAVNNVLDYAAKVFQNAEFAEKLTTAKKINEAAKKNLKKGNLGMNKSFSAALSSLLNIPVEQLTNENIDEYNDFVSKFSSRKRTIPLQEANTLTMQANELYEKVFTPQEEVEVSPADSKVTKKAIASINSKDTDGEFLIENYSDFIQAKLNDIDTTTLFNLVEKLNKVKDAESQDIIDGVNEYAELRNELVNEANAVDVKLTAIDELSKDSASKYKQLKKKDFIDLTGKELEEAIVNMDNINNGFYTYPANNLMRTIESNRASKNVIPIIKNIDKSKLATASTRVYGKIKSALKKGKKSSILESVRSNPLNVIDDVYGNFKGRQISDNIFEKAATSLAKYESKMSNILAKVEQIEKGLYTNIRNEAKKKFEVTAYLLQKEYESNDNKKGTASANDFIDATVEDFNKDPSESNYGEGDIKILQEIKAENKTASEMFESFSPKEKKAIKEIEAIYQELSELAAYTATVVRGDGIELFNNYVHHKTSINKESDASDLLKQTNSILSPSTKSKAAISRTAGAKPIEFDPISTLIRSARYTLLDYNLTDQLKTINQTLTKIQDDIVNSPESTKMQKDAANALRSSFNEAIKNVLLSNFTEYNALTRAFDKARTVGYQAALASVPRAAAEYLSNLSYVMTASPKEFSSGVSKYGKWSFGQSGLDIVRNSGSKAFTKLYGDEKLAGSKAEASGFVRGKKGSARAKSEAGVAMEVLSMGVRPIAKVSSKIAENLISTPDKAISRPLFFGTFAAEFKNQTGNEIDFDKMSEGDKEYLIDNRDAIEKATRAADVAVQRAATTNSRMDVILKNQIRPDDATLSKVYKTMNSYMSRFAINEYTTARQGIASLLGSGEMSRSQGAATLVALNLRMATYLALSQFFGTSLNNALGFGDDEEDLVNDLKRGTVGSAVSLISRRTLGNAAMIPINIGIEKLNEEYGQELRDGKKYDPYKHSIVYSQVTPEKIYRNPAETITLTGLGPYQPIAKPIIRAIKTFGKFQNAKTKKDKRKYMDELLSLRSVTDALGATGMLPFYRDIRNAILAEEYKD